LLANAETLILRLMTRRLQSILQTQIFALKIWWAGRDLICLQCESKIERF